MIRRTMALLHCRYRRVVGIALALLLVGRFAIADDLADEADLHFQLGAEAYTKSDYRGALQHFLLSNRLVPNKNVVFNIARTYEQIAQAPDAYRYYTLASEGETDLAARQRIEEAIARVRPKVAILRVKTTPPGATVYLDRKDLGPRGSAPRSLGLGAGRYKVIVEMPGYEPAESPPVDVSVGTETPIELSLQRIRGTVEISVPQVEARPLSGVAIHVDQEEAPVACTAPCVLELDPGKHTLYSKKEGFLVAESVVDVPAKATVAVRPKLAAIVSNVVVNADLREALVTVDGVPRGFTPTVLNLSVGRHTVRVTRTGFRPQEQVVDVKQTEQSKLEFVLSTSSIEEVTAASRISESVEDAPASVTIIGGQELRAMGYPTIAEAVRGVRGLYLSYDDVYFSLGVRGFSRPGDYGNRILVMIDGQPTNDNYIWSSYVAFDGRVDLEDIERIEIVRGAGSVLYGTGAFFGVINLVTRDRNVPTHGEASLGTALGAGRARVSGTWRITPEAGAWLSASGAQAPGTDHYYPEYRGSNDYRGAVSDGVVRDADGFHAGMLQGRLWYKAFTTQWFIHSHFKNAPSAQFGTNFGDPSAFNKDTRAFVETRLEPELSSTVQSLTRAHFNYYGYTNLLPYPKYDATYNATTNPCPRDPASESCSYGVENDTYRGAWGGLEQRFVLTPRSSVRITAGAEYIHHFTAQQLGMDDRARGPADAAFDATIPSDRRNYIIQRNDTFDSFAGYLLADVRLNSRVKLSAGARVDDFVYPASSGTDFKFDFWSQFNPRIALVVKPYEKGTAKVILGKAFRQPSVYELFYQGLRQERSSGLKPEQVYSSELEFSHRLSANVVATAAGYVNYVTKLIELEQTDRGTEQYRNSNADVVVVGGEAEIRREWRQGTMLSATATVQKASYVHDANLRRVANSPLAMASIKGAVPIIGRSLMAMSRLSVEGIRFDLQTKSSDPRCDTGSGSNVCPLQGTTDPGVIWDLVFSGEIEQMNARYAVGLYNAMDWKYDAVASAEYLQRTIRQPGRTAFASLTVTF